MENFGLLNLIGEVEQLILLTDNFQNPKKVPTNKLPKID
jgi:hypothetical protein